MAPRPGVIGYAPGEAEPPRPGADRELQHLDVEELGDEEVAELVNEDERTQKEQEEGHLL